MTIVVNRNNNSNNNNKSSLQLYVFGILLTLTLIGISSLLWLDRNITSRLFLPQPSKYYGYDNNYVATASNNTTTMMARTKSSSVMTKEQQQRDEEEQNQYNNAVSSSSSSSSSSATTITYHIQPQLFTTTMLNCFYNQNCHIYYLHSEKTGGTDIEKRFFQLFPPRIPTVALGHNVTEHHSKTLKMFLRNATKYCTAKFMSLEIEPLPFIQEVIPTCMKHNSQQQQQRDSHAIALLTYREPISRTLSAIHQTCNKNLKIRDQTTLRACQKCNYDSTPTYWNEWIDYSNNLYQQLQQIISQHSPSYNIPMNTTAILAIDMLDLERFYKQTNQINAIIPKNHSSPKLLFQSITKHNNIEKLQHCSFAMNSIMIKKLQYSSNVYRNFTHGGGILY